MISVVAGIAAFIVNPALGVTFFTGSALAFTVPLTTLLTGVAAVSAAIGFAPEIPDLDIGRNLAANLTIQSSPNAVRGIPFGRVGIAGQILFREEIEGSGDTPDELLLILGLAGVPATSLEKFTLNGTLVFDGETTTGPGAIASGTFGGDLWVWFRTGEELTAAFPEIAALSTAWAAKARVLRGIPCIGIRLKVTEKLKGRLEPLAQIKGMKLYDPRLDSTVPGGAGAHRFDDPTTWAWSQNPKLAELIYFRGYDINSVPIFGMGEPADAIDLEHLASEANICEEQIAVVGGGTIDRYTINGMLFPEAEHGQNLQQLLTASAGTIDASTGILRTFAGAWRAPSGDPLGEADIDGAPTEIQLQKDPSEEVNIVQGVFADPLDSWEVKEYPARVDQASIDAFGANSVTLDLPFTTDHRIAQRIAKIFMLRANAGRIMAARYWPKLLPLQPGDIVEQTYLRYGIDAETFRVDVWGLEAVEDRQGQPTLRVPMRLVEEREEWFDWNEATEEIQTTTVTSLPAMDQRPDLRNMNGMPVFEGPLPPANPLVGWLWLDEDVQIFFRWTGSGWRPVSDVTSLPGGSYITDPTFTKTSGFYEFEFENPAALGADYHNFHWMNTHPGTDISLVAGEGIGLGTQNVIRFTPNVADAQRILRSVGRPMVSNFIAGQWLQVSLRVRKRDSTTLSDHQLEIYVIQQRDNLDSAGSDSLAGTINAAEINGWAVNVWQDYIWTVQVASTPSADGPWIGLQIVASMSQFFSQTPMRIDVDYLNMVPIATP